MYWEPHNFYRGFSWRETSPDETNRKTPVLSTSSGDVRRALRVFTKDPCYTLQEQDPIPRIRGPIATIRFTITVEESIVEESIVEEPPIEESIVVELTVEEGAAAAPRDDSIPVSAPLRVESIPSRAPTFASLGLSTPTASPSRSSPPSPFPTASKSLRYGTRMSAPILSCYIDNLCLRCVRSQRRMELVLRTVILDRFKVSLLLKRGNLCFSRAS
jgi:hypothetical protein